jgi:myo-inositol-1(or 4)-monophosphatase
MILTKTNAALYQALDAATKAARAGREVLLHYFGRLENIEVKFQAGLVSEADKESEVVIFETLRKYFPSDEYLGEESAGSDLAVTKPAKGSRWIVDPLDGTTNYIHRFPIYAISIGLEINGEIQVGLIDMPALKETYCAILGQGVWVNGQPMKVSNAAQLKDTLLATGFSGDHETILQEQLRVFSHAVRQCRGIRRAGAAAYDLTQVARGVFDGYWERGIKPWDGAAGILMVREAGGRVTTYSGKEYNPYDGSILATNGKVHQEFLASALPLIDQNSD